MSNLTCPGCGSVYPLASVQKYDRFTCAVCHNVIMVPIAGPAPTRAAAGEAAVAARPAAQPAASRPQQTSAPAKPAVPAPSRSASRAHQRAASSTPKKGPNWPLIGAVAGLCGVVVVAVIVGLDKSLPPAPPPADSSAAAPKSATPALPPAPRADPDKDPAAWKALPAAERSARAAKYLAGVDRTSGSALSAAYTFLKQRDEQDAIKALAEIELARDPTSGWAHQARGDTMVLERIERCLGECNRADEADTDAVRRLAKIRKDKKPPEGTWWADAALQKEIDTCLTEIKADEKRLQDPYEWAVAKWTIYQRRIEVMRDHPAITGTVGPYLIFVQIKAPVGTAVEAVPEIEMNRAQRVLNQNKTLFSAFYEGFHETFGKPFGLTKYDKTNTDEKSILKANIFADSTTWEAYHQRIGFAPTQSGIRAYYQSDEPRFVVSYDPGGDELSSETDQVQCHEATHQLLHFYTWDVSRKIDGKELSWAQCNTRPPWLEEGFAEFFSSHRRENGKYVWMQPLQGRLLDLWLCQQVAQKKKWANWSFDEMLAIVDFDQIASQAARRVFPKPPKQVTQQQAEDAELAVRMMSPAYYGKSLSLVSFLWSAADKSGKPLYRDAFLKLLQDSFHVRQAIVEGRGPQTHIVGASDFRKTFGLEKDDKYRAFEKEWLAWENDLLAKAQKADWPSIRDRVFSSLGLR